MNAAEELKAIFEENQDKRICVVGTSCSGKSTLNKQFVESVDMDQVVFAHLTPNEIVSVDGTDWSPEVGQKMGELAKRHVTAVPGKPVFGTVIFDDCDLIVYLDIDEDLLKERCEMRGVSYKDATNMDKHIRRQIASSPIQTIVINVDRNIEAKIPIH